ncbi:hypothetical protein GOP47_0022591 [Adiantum capillus-veneris]|uniref:ATP-dependent DNA helicase n=1 Tax=Adiantum capillus-veneris TaxID=13818 RepID=A0A9D4U6R7_ADICA|nr:hypothetical protein GOP47_0022591 [Adiantum capillus-veneris]
MDDGLVAASVSRDGLLSELLSMGFDISVATEAVTTQDIATLADAIEFLLAGNSQPVTASTSFQNSKPTLHVPAGHGPIKPATRLHADGCKAETIDEKWRACSVYGNEADDGLFDKVENALSKYFGFSRLKPFQMEALRAWANHQDCLVLAATGSGKSLCFQLPALLTGKVVIVVSPLISLMHDQCQQLSRRGISACFLGSGQGDKSVEKKAMAGMYSIVYVCPETLPRIIHSLKELACKRGIALFAIDEAHCISKWGHDFRPDYRRLSTLREVFKIQNLPGLKDPVPVMALTATATDCVQMDIMKSLKMDTGTTRVVRTTLFRPNLRFSVLHSKTCRPSSYPEDFKILLDYYTCGFGSSSQVSKCPSINTSCFIGNGSNLKLEKEKIRGDQKYAYWANRKTSAEVDEMNFESGDIYMGARQNEDQDEEEGEEEEDEDGSSDKGGNEDFDESQKARYLALKDDEEKGLTVDFLEDDDEDEMERLGGDFEVACNEILVDDPMFKNRSIQSRSPSRAVEEGPSIVYVPTRKEAESVAKFFCKSGLKAAPYHAKLAKGHLRRVHEQFHLGTMQVVVATIAFGMGIDKPDVRHIIHYGWPQSLEAYYQEAGRAGRDGLPSECILYCDITTLPSLLPSRRDQEQTQHALHMLDQCFRYGLSTNKCRANTLLQYFGEDLATTRCEICDVCSTGPPPLENLTMEAEILLMQLSSPTENHGPSNSQHGIVNQRKRRAGNERAYRHAIEEIAKYGEVPQRNCLWWRGFGRVVADAGYLKEASPVGRPPRKLIVPHLRNPEVTADGQKFLDDRRREGSVSFWVHPEGDMIQALLEPSRLSRAQEWGRGWGDPEVRKQRLARKKISRRPPRQKRQRRSRDNSRGRQKTRRVCA